METKNQACRKKGYQKIGFDFKLFIIGEIENGKISANYASKKYNVSRSSISYWIKKYSTLRSKDHCMSKKEEIKELKEKIAELEFVKEFQQDIIADMELITGVDLSKKSLPKTLAKEIELKKSNRLKQSGFHNVLG